MARYGAYSNGIRIPPAEADLIRRLFEHGCTLNPTALSSATLDRMRMILQQRWIEEPAATLQEIADQIGSNSERVRVLECQLRFFLARSVDFEFYRLLRRSKSIEIIPLSIERLKVGVYGRRLRGLFASELELVREVLAQKRKAILDTLDSRQKVLAPKIIESRWLSQEPTELSALARVTRSKPSYLEGLEYQMLANLGAALSAKEFTHFSSSALGALLTARVRKRDRH